MKTKVLGSIFGLAFGLAALPQAHAITQTYTIGSGSSVSANKGSGLIIDTALASDLAGKTFSLNDGQSYTFNFFKISTPELAVNLSDDTVARTITATLDFAVPDVNAVITGVTFTGIVDLIKTAGQVTWGAAQTISVADRKFSVSLNGATFDAALLGNYGDSPAIISATVKQISSSASSVPDGGATILLLGTALGALLVVRRLALS